MHISLTAPAPAPVPAPVSHPPSLAPSLAEIEADLARAEARLRVTDQVRETVCLDNIEPAVYAPLNGSPDPRDASLHSACARLQKAAERGAIAEHILLWGGLTALFTALSATVPVAATVAGCVALGGVAVATACFWKQQIDGLTDLDARHEDEIRRRDALVALRSALRATQSAAAVTSADDVIRIGSLTVPRRSPDVLPSTHAGARSRPETLSS